MKKSLIYILIAVAVIVSINAVRPDLEPIAQQQPQHTWYNFDGQWLPDVEQAKIGAENFYVLQNMRYTDGGIEGVQGSTKVNTTAIPINAIAQEIDNGIHFKKDQPSESHVLVAGGKSGITQIFKNDTAIPDAGDFSGTTLYSIDTSAEQVRFSPAPGGNVAVLDGKESLIWGGDEMRVAAFITSESAVTNDTINPRDYTEQVNNKLSTPDEVAVIGGGNDWATKLLLHFDGTDGSTTFTDSNSGATSTHTVSGESGNDSNCVLLIHSNTTDGSTTFVDSSQGGSDHTADITVVNSAHHETDQQKFGTTSIYLNNGTSDKLTIADSADWDFGAGSFSLEFWVMWKGSISNTGLIGRYVGEANTWGMQYYSGAIYWYYGNGTSHNFSWTPPAADTWYHLVIARDGTNLRFFVDGIQQDSTQTDNTNYNTASALTIGHYGVGSLIDGYFDEIAIFKGSANGRTANFTPPTSAMSTTAQIDVDQVKFGTASVYFDDLSSLYLADSVDWYNGTTNFTVDMWVMFPASDIGQDNYIFTQSEDSSTDVVYLGYFGSPATDVIEFRLRDGGVVQVNISAAWTPDAYTWYHIAIIRGWGGDINEWALTVNGKVLGTDTYSGTYPDYNAGLFIGENADNNVLYQGWIDEFRWTKGRSRWESNFEPPSRAYVTGSKYWVIATTRPISGASFYVGDKNTLSGQTVTAKEWNSSSWTGLALTGNTETSMGLYQSGKVSWSSTVDTSKPKFLEDRLFYWYLFELSDGEATIYNVTVDAPMQPIIDLWDGVYRQPISFQTVDSSGTSDYTLEVNEGSTDLYPIGAKMGGLTATDHTIMIFEDRIQAVRLEMLGVNQTAITSGVSVYYWNGSDWVVQSSQYDETDQDNIPLNKSGTISWQPPERAEEFTRSLYGVEGYAYKFVWNGTLDSAGDSDATLIDVVYGIPAPIKVRPFKFPAQFKNRLLLMGYTEGNQGNRIDYSMTNAPDVWNGEETSMDGIQSLYVGGNEDLTAGVQIYNRYGSNIYTTFLMLKKTETYLLLGDGPSGEDAFRILPVSKNIGCPAPLTLATAEVSFETAQGQPTRNIAIWLSYSGPVIFDGAVLMPVAGINSYFDPVDDNYLGASAIESAVGWYDATYKEYNLRVGDEWFAYDLNRKKWYSKSTPTMPTVGFPVTDVNGSTYIYSGTTTGYLMRLEYGDTWDGTGIEQIVETGDFFPVEDPWYRTKIDRIKVAARKLTESKELSITHYADGNAYSNDLETLKLTRGAGDIAWANITHPNGLAGWMHRLRFSVTTSSTTKGFRPLGWGFQRSIDYEDEQ